MNYEKLKKRIIKALAKEMCGLDSDWHYYGQKYRKIIGRCLDKVREETIREMSEKENTYITGDGLKCGWHKCKICGNTTNSIMPVKETK